MNPDRMLNEDVMNEHLSLKLLWEVPYTVHIAPLGWPSSDRSFTLIPLISNLAPSSNDVSACVCA